MASNGMVKSSLLEENVANIGMSLLVDDMLEEFKARSSVAGLVIVTNLVDNDYGGV